MNENKLNLTDIDLLIEESKKINFSSEPEIRNLVRKYPKNFKEVGGLDENSLIEYFKIGENYEKIEISDHAPLGYKTLVIKKKITFNDSEYGEELKNLPNWKKLKNRRIYHKAHIVAKSLGGKRFYPHKKYLNSCYNGFISTKFANTGKKNKGGMWCLEKKMIDYLDTNKNNYILYECRVIYKHPKDIIPIFIVMIIVSDDKTINNTYFVWNIQLGYTINYENGNYSSFKTSTFYIILDSLH